MDFIKAQRTKISKIGIVNLSTSTVLITGSNTGLGLETARQILESTPRRLILAVRNFDKGNEAKKDLEHTKQTSTQIDVLQLDQSSFESVQKFVKELEGQDIDIAILNAGVWNFSFLTTKDGHESELQVNLLSPALLSLLLLPNLRLAASRPRPADAPKPHLVFVSSGLYSGAKFLQRNAPKGGIITALNDPKQYIQQDRYPTTKLMGLLWMRELASKISSEEIIINAVSPGFCKTGLNRNAKGVVWIVSSLGKSLIGREVGEGARTIVDAAVGKGESSHGRYLSEMEVKDESVLVRSEEGAELQGRLWDEVLDGFVKAGMPVREILEGL